MYKFLIMGPSPAFATFSILGPNIRLSTLLSDTLKKSTVSGEKIVQIHEAITLIQWISAHRLSERLRINRESCRESHKPSLKLHN